MFLDVESVVKQWRANLAKQVDENPRSPSLAVILVGDNPASKAYVRNKEKVAAECHISTTTYHFPNDVSTAEFNQALVDAHELFDAVMVQLPLPNHLDVSTIYQHIFPVKDADGFHPNNIGKLALGDEEHSLIPCTPLGIIKLLDHLNYQIEGQNVVIVGRSNIVGKPMSMLFVNRGATVTMCNSRTKNLKEITHTADILVCAVGKERLITADMIKPNSIVIDVGINRNKDGKICGDVDPECAEIATVTPVPKGVGLLTTYMLMENTLKSYNMQHNIKIT